MANRDEIGARTSLVGLFGHPARHSLSPIIHNAAFKIRGLDFVYLAFDVLPEHLGAAVDGLRALGMRGVNLTVPHKEAVMPYLDRVDGLAERIGAVNTIVNDQGTLVGHNTDVGGFIDALRVVLPDGAGGRDCLVAGAGGASRAVVAALVAEGAARISIYNRHPERAAALCADAAQWGPTDCGTVPAEGLGEAVSRAELLINATPLGLDGSVKLLPLPVDTLHSGQVVVDLAYASSRTALVDAALVRGAHAIDGKEMLVRQAALAYRYWTGVEPPVDVMRMSLEQGER
jgi:shikimate dehydrogenase